MPTKFYKKATSKKFISTLNLFQEPNRLCEQLEDFNKSDKSIDQIKFPLTAISENKYIKPEEDGFILCCSEFYSQKPFLDNGVNSLYLFNAPKADGFYVLYSSIVFFNLEIIEKNDINTYFQSYVCKKTNPLKPAFFTIYSNDEITAFIVD